MRLKNMRDCHARFARRLDVNITVCAGIKHCGNSCVIIADEIRKLGDAFCLNGFKNERHAKI